MRKLAFRALFMLSFQLLLSAQPAPGIVTGPAVGSHIPDFQVPDQNGHKQTPASIAGPKGSLLVFFRSADW